MPSRECIIVVPSDAPVQIGDSPHLDRIRDRGEIRVFHDHPASIADQIERAVDAQILINSRGHIKWDREALRQLPQLRMITTCSIGTDSIDLVAAAEQGITVSNIPGKTAPVVAEHTLALILAGAKRVAFQTSELKAGRWTRALNLSLAGSTLGIIGTGAIGGEVARLATAIGMRVIAWTFHPSAERAEELGVKYVELDELLATSDVVSIHVRLTPESQGLIDQEKISKMKPGSLLVNTARGDVVDTSALIAALESEHLAGAAVDVFDTEPLPSDHPLLRCAQVVLTPHSADHTLEGIDLLNAGAVDNVSAFLEQRPQNVVS